MGTGMNSEKLGQERSLLQKMNNGAPFSLERELLVLSGLNTEEKVLSYQQKIDDIFSRFLNKCDAKDLSNKSKPPLYLHRHIAKCLFEYLWTSKPKRFGECFLLADVVEAQLNPDVHQTVGTCVGLTCLYSVLALRVGLNLSLLSDSAHLLSRLRVGEQTTDIDHTDPQGFGCINCEDFHEFPLRTLTANVLNSRGLRNEREGKFAAAEADYRQAIFVNPEYANAYNNRGNIRFWQDDIDGAIEDYTTAIRLNPNFCEAYCNRGMARQKLGRYNEARLDYNAAISTNSDYADAQRCLRLLDDIEPRSAFA